MKIIKAIKFQVEVSGVPRVTNLDEIIIINDNSGIKTTALPLNYNTHIDISTTIKVFNISSKEASITNEQGVEMIPNHNFRFPSNSCVTLTKIKENTWFIEL